MRPRLVLLLLAVAFAAVACGDDGGPEATPTDEPTAATETVEIHIGDGEFVEVQAEIADDDAERRRGLMFRESLPPDGGMIFVFDGPQTGGFWMKDTLIPLSIAFFDGRGRIVRILDMEPCRADPCPVYDPGVEYRGALEVNRGAFRRMGVEAGDRVEVAELLA